MKIIVFGATGSTGREVVRQALSQGHEVIATVRRSDSLQPEANLTIRTGDVMHIESLHNICREAQVSISCIGPRHEPKSSRL